MKVVIDIPEWHYNQIYKGYQVNGTYFNLIWDCIAKGVPLKECEEHTSEYVGNNGSDSTSNSTSEYFEALDLNKKLSEERPQGEWVGNVFNEHHCNRCGHPALWEEEPDDYYEVQSRFCPNCGADMRREKEE